MGTNIIHAYWLSLILLFSIPADKNLKLNFEYSTH